MFSYYILRSSVAILAQVAILFKRFHETFALCLLPRYILVSRRLLHFGFLARCAFSTAAPAAYIVHAALLGVFFSTAASLPSGGTPLSFCWCSSLVLGSAQCPGAQSTTPHISVSNRMGKDGKYSAGNDDSQQFGWCPIKSKPFVWFKNKKGKWAWKWVQIENDKPDDKPDKSTVPDKSKDKSESERQNVSYRNVVVGASPGVGSSPPGPPDTPPSKEDVLKSRIIFFSVPPSRPHFWW